MSNARKMLADTINADMYKYLLSQTTKDLIEHANDIRDQIQCLRLTHSRIITILNKRAQKP